MGVEIQGGTERAEMAGNGGLRRRAPGARIGIRFGRQTRDNHLRDNVFRGFAAQIAGLCGR